VVFGVSMYPLRLPIDLEAVRGEVGPVLDIISDCRTRRLCSHLSTTSHDCDHNGHSNYIYCREDGRENEERRMRREG
jgi:hypothetical protein